MCHSHQQVSGAAWQISASYGGSARRRPSRRILVVNFDLGYLLEEPLLVATGSQGETGAALQRLAVDSHPINIGGDQRFQYDDYFGNESRSTHWSLPFVLVGLQ